MLVVLQWPSHSTHITTQSSVLAFELIFTCSRKFLCWNQAYSWPLQGYSCFINASGKADGPSMKEQSSEKLEGSTSPKGGWRICLGQACWGTPYFFRTGFYLWLNLPIKLWHMHLIIWASLVASRSFHLHTWLLFHARSISPSRCINELWRALQRSGIRLIPARNFLLLVEKPKQQNWALDSKRFRGSLSRGAWEQAWVFSARKAQLYSPYIHIHQVCSHDYHVSKKNRSSPRHSNLGSGERK